MLCKVQYEPQALMWCLELENNICEEQEEDEKILFCKSTVMDGI
jgi:hypothetical protein